MEFISFFRIYLPKYFSLHHQTAAVAKQLDLNLRYYKNRSF